MLRALCLQVQPAKQILQSYKGEENFEKHFCGAQQESAGHHKGNSHVPITRQRFPGWAGWQAELEFSAAAISVSRTGLRQHRLRSLLRIKTREIGWIQPQERSDTKPWALETQSKNPGPLLLVPMRMMQLNSPEGPGKVFLSAWSGKFSISDIWPHVWRLGGIHPGQLSITPNQLQGLGSPPAGGEHWWHN